MSIPCMKKRVCVHSKHGHAGRNQCGDVNKHVKKKSTNKAGGEHGHFGGWERVHEYGYVYMEQAAGERPRPPRSCSAI